jgi:hypothetical protein
VLAKLLAKEMGAFMSIIANGLWISGTENQVIFVKKTVIFTSYQSSSCIYGMCVENN